MKKEKELPTVSGDREAIELFKQALASGQHWYLALLEAIGLWSSAEETYDGRHYRYLIGGQAFDWLLLAERLCQEFNGLLPEQEMLDLLISGQPPLELSEGEFEALIGGSKYRAYLNYFYGVVVERYLLLAVEEEVEKEHRAQVGLGGSEDSYRRIYGADQPSLLRRFREETGYDQGNSITISELREFTYWLFQYRCGTQIGLGWPVIPRRPWPICSASVASNNLHWLHSWRANKRCRAISQGMINEDPVDTARGNYYIERWDRNRRGAFVPAFEQGEVRGDCH